MDYVPDFLVLHHCAGEKSMRISYQNVERGQAVVVALVVQVLALAEELSVFSWVKLAVK
jgi:hypothetical protein